MSAWKQARWGRAGKRLALVAGTLLAGCALLNPQPKPATPPATKAPGIGAQIETLQARIRAGNAPPSVHRSLAMLLIDPANPARNYGAALRELERYAAADPAGADKTPEVRTWLLALRALEEMELDRSVLDVRLRAVTTEASASAQALEKTRRELQEAKRAKDAMTKELADKEELLNALRRENREMKETIEKLKELDLRMDQLRKRTR